MATNNSLNEKNVGLQSLTTAGAINGRTLTGTSNQISISNGDGTAGAPTAALTSTIQVSGISFDSGTTTLDTYVQGTFTPTIDNATTPPTVAYTAQIGRYTRIGNRVFINLLISLSSYAGGSGQVLLKTLPYTSSSSASNNTVHPLAMENVTFGASVLWYFAAIGLGVTQVAINGNRSATTPLVLAVGAPQNTAKFKTTLSYEI